MRRMRYSPSFETRRSASLHCWNNGHRSASYIARSTKIPIRTVRYNIVKIKEQGETGDRPRSDRPLRLTMSDSKTIGQWIRRQKDITAREIAEKLFEQRDRHVSRWTVQRQLVIFKFTVEHQNSPEESVMVREKYRRWKF
ncbi:unnamed protein product [Didymodactylos carnosus]|uniref:Transposase Tc1-like domain-containing protein n=1 Tax=Didymodactylos carnosus TaxID=1234261 RepID=A0A816AL76_9BILA|nr:unnamed protein product [Didymodactylos carnosus]CAF4472729.1 unnamed protein product [Didymodactylos carnosus]